MGLTTNVTSLRLAGNGKTIKKIIIESKRKSIGWRSNLAIALRRGTTDNYKIHVQELGINYFEGKTGNAHKGLELNRFGMEVLEKYDYEFPQVPSNFRMNQNLKAIARLLKWRHLKDVPKFDLRERVISSIEKTPLQEIISTKFMRKVAISMDARMGVPVQVGMKHRIF